GFYAYHMAVVQRFYLDRLRIPRDRFRFAELDEHERAFYNKVHFDVQVRQDSLGGFKEVGGVHYRTDHDLTGHAAASKKDLAVLGHTTLDDGTVTLRERDTMAQVRIRAQSLAATLRGLIHGHANFKDLGPTVARN